MVTGRVPAKKAAAKKAAPVRKDSPAGTQKVGYAKSPVMTPHVVVQAYVAWQRAQRTADELKAEHDSVLNIYVKDVLGGEEKALLPKLGRPSKSPLEKLAPTDSHYAVVDGEILDSARLEKMSITELRLAAKQIGLTEQVKKVGILAELEAKGLVRQSDDEIADEDDEDIEDDDEEIDDVEEEDIEDVEEEDEEEDDDEGLTREDLEAMSLKELQATAKANGIPKSEWKDMDTEALVDLIYGDDEEEEDDDEVDEEDEVEDDDEDGEEGGLTREDLEAMTGTDVLQTAKAYAKQEGKAIPEKIKKSKKGLIDWLMSEEDDEE